jgi:hypothetical protein
VAWIDIAQHGVVAVEAAMASVERLAALDVRWACSGHGAPIEDPPATFAGAIRRYEKWLAQPERIGWHACKRIFAYELMLGPQTAEECNTYLLRSPWLQAYAERIFRTTAQEFATELLAEMVRSGAAQWVEGRLTPTTPFQQPAPGWCREGRKPADWPQ